MSNEELTLVAPVSDEELDALFARAASKKIDSAIYSRVEAPPEVADSDDEFIGETEPPSLNFPAFI